MKESESIVELYIYTILAKMYKMYKERDRGLGSLHSIKRRIKAKRKIGEKEVE